MPEPRKPMTQDEINDRAQETVAERKQAEFHQSLKTVLATKEGRHVVAEFFASFPMYRTAYNDHGSKMAYNCGQQSAAHWFRDKMKEAKIYQDLFPLLEKEDIAREERFEGEMKTVVDTFSKRS